MSLEAYFNPYPSLKKVFWPRIAQSPQISPHPLLDMLYSDDHRARNVANRTDFCCRRILSENPNWLASKADIITSSDDSTSISSTLGEIRAYGELLWVWGKKVAAGTTGRDFFLNMDDCKVNIEVFTQQHRTQRSRIEHKPNQTKNITSQIIEIFPFGYAQRRGIDNSKGEAVSKLASIKAVEHQFREDEINILWCDLKDPTLWMFGFGLNEFFPLNIFREEITSGAFWSAFYGRKGIPVLDGLPVGGYEGRNNYVMEFEGRFWQKSKVDFVVADILTDQIVFQNPHRPTKIPAWVFKDLHRLFAFNLECSWLDWPISGELLPEVNSTLKKITSYSTVFRDDG